MALVALGGWNGQLVRKVWVNHVNSRPDLPPFPVTLEKWQKLIPVLQLSPKQLQIVELILRDQCDKQIAELMGLKVPTIRTYKTRIFHRLEVSDRTQLILHLFALSHGIDPHRRQ